MDAQPSQNTISQETPKSRNALYIIGYIVLLVVLTGGAMVYGVRTKPSVMPVTQEAISPTPPIISKFTGASILGPCNITEPICSDASYECFNTVLGEPCPNASQGGECPDAKEIPGDNLCHRTCQNENDCSEGYYCRTIPGFVGEVPINYSLCFEGTAPSEESTESAVVQ